jgi:hypothetical protein
MKIEHSKFIKREYAEKLYRQGVRFSDDSSFGHLLTRGHDIDFEPTRDPVPTNAKPGSIEKLKVFEERLLRGEKLSHADDEQTWANLEEQSLLSLFAKEQMDLRKEESDKAKRKSEKEAKAKQARKQKNSLGQKTVRHRKDSEKVQRIKAFAKSLNSKKINESKSA